MKPKVFESREALLPLNGGHFLFPGRKHFIERVPADGSSKKKEEKQP